MAKNKIINVQIYSNGIKDYNFDYVQSAGKQLYERFVLVKDDMELKNIEIYQIVNGAKVPFKKYKMEDNEIENYRDVCCYPQEDTTIELFYEKSSDRLAFRLDLSNIRHLLATTVITALPSPVSYFYSDSDDCHDYTHIFDEEKTYYYDDFEGISFVVRLTSQVDLRICISGKEYTPVETEECWFNKQKVYEY